MKKKNENTLLYGLLIIAVVLTTLLAIALGLIVSVKPGNPIKTVMQYIQNGFEIPEEDEKSPKRMHRVKPWQRKALMKTTFSHFRMG